MPTVFVHFGLPAAGLSHLHRNDNGTARKKNQPVPAVIETLLQQAFDVIDCELEVIRGELAERFAAAHLPVSNVRWAGKGAKSKMSELAEGMLHSGELETCDGTKLTLTDIVRAFGLGFNVDVPHLHIQNYQNRNRKKGAAQYLRHLAALVEKASNNLL